MTTRRRRPAQPTAEESQPAVLEAPQPMGVVSLEQLQALAAQAPAVPPAPEQPVAERGVSDGTMVCTVCLRPVAAGELYAKTAVRGVNHLEPCSHRA